MTMRARAAAWRAIAKMQHPDLSPQDIEDLEQVADVTLWRLRDRDPGYAFGAAVRECCKYISRSIFGKNPSSTIQYDYLENLIHDDDDDDDDSTTISLTESEIVDILLAGRRGGERGHKIAQTEARILLLVLEGVRDNAVIADVLGMNVNTVRVYRTRIRNRLAQYCRANHIK